MFHLYPTIISFDKKYHDNISLYSNIFSHQPYFIWSKELIFSYESQVTKDDNSLLSLTLKQINHMIWYVWIVPINHMQQNY